MEINKIINSTSLIHLTTLILRTDVSEFQSRKLLVQLAFKIIEGHKKYLAQQSIKKFYDFIIEMLNVNMMVNIQAELRNNRNKMKEMR